MTTTRPKCPCPESSEWCEALIDTGYPYCPRCQEHHRHPETCPGVTPEGEPADYPQDVLP